MSYRTRLKEDGTLERVESGQSSSDSQSPLSADVLARLGEMTREELLTLVRRFACQCGVAAMMSREETAQAMRDKLAEIALKPITPGLNLKADIGSCIAAIDKWLDRTVGKAVQPIAQKIEMNVNPLVLAAQRELDALPMDALLRIRDIVQGDYSEVEEERLLVD